MREAGIQIEPYQFLDLLELEIKKKPNQHVTAKLCGRIAENLADKYVDMASEHDSIKIKALDEGGREEIIFSGVVKTIGIKMNNGVRTLEIEAISATYLMDLQPENATFQNENQTYGEILDKVKKPYPKSEVFMAIGGKETTKSIVVQYQETDWQFAKRLASHFYSFIYPDYKGEGARFYFGMPETKTEQLTNLVSYKMKKDLGEYLYKTQNHVSGVNENDALYYLVKSREIYDLCQAIDFKGRKLFVAEIVSKLEGAVLFHYYSLKGERGFKVKKEYNEKLIGASLDAKVLDVSKDRIKVHMQVDQEQDQSTAKWFPFSTVYSSPDGTGWYCMPEKGDTMRVYFGDEKEEHAFAISAVHEQSSSGEKRANPDIKVLSTKHGKEIIFTEKGIEIKSGDGLRIILSDEEGILIESDQDIKIHSQKDLSLQAGKSLMLLAKEKIELTQGEKTKLELKEDITLKGGQVKMNK